MNPLTADQAAFMLHTLGLPALRAEHTMTTAVVAAIPPGRATIDPIPTRAAPSNLAWHIISAEIKYLDAIATGIFPHRLEAGATGGWWDASDVLAWSSQSIRARR